MSSSSATGAGSRSPSPATPEACDSLDPIVVNSDIDISNSWYLSSHNAKTDTRNVWDVDSLPFISSRKPDDDQMLQLDELLEQHAYDDSSSSVIDTSIRAPQPHVVPLFGRDMSASPGLTSNVYVSTQTCPISNTKPVPPPATMPRKHDPALLNQRVVYPSKESCFNLPIIFPSIPEGGTKSRVETQIRVTVDLADSTSSSNSLKYDRVGSWKWLKLPPGTATKKRTRKQGKIDPEPEDVLHLSVTISCASPPHNRVLSCSSCQAREAKRVAKKLAARVRPARSDTESGDDRPSKGKQLEDTTSIIQFNCAEVLDFSTGSVVLPLRITCYCRHHREKLGFNVHFTMMDHVGRIVGTGSSRPIMITDDHKTAPSTNAARQAEYANALMNVDSEWPQMASAYMDPATDSRAPSKRKKDTISSIGGKRRHKPYDITSKPSRPSREGSVSSAPSPSHNHASLPLTRASTPSVIQLLGMESSPMQQSPRELASRPLDQQQMLHAPTVPETSMDCNAISSPIDVASKSSPSLPSSVVMASHSHPIPYMFFDPHQLSSNQPLQFPIIHRLIPSIGPTHGGIEVTVLGANFHPTLQLNCVFGNTPASSTQRWSDNTLVCILPPRSTAGVVSVWFDGLPKAEDQAGSLPSLFTYADESDRALMELALQVVGLKMTGKIEDAKNVAMRIVGGPDNGGSHNGTGDSNKMQLASNSFSTRDLRPLLFVRGRENEDFECLIIDFLRVLNVPLGDGAPNALDTEDAISHTTPNGHTLLHLAAFLGFCSLVEFLAKLGIDIDARDRNGYTALHFAALSQSDACIRALLNAGADSEIVNSLGETPREVAGETDVFAELMRDDDLPSSSDEEAQWGDVDEMSDNATPRRFGMRRRSSKRLLLRRRSSILGRTSGLTTASSTCSEKIDNDEKKPLTGITDAKQTASFIELIQRTLAQLPAPQGMIPNISQLPLPQLPQLPGLAIPTVPWGALPQLPVVFPVIIPSPGWPSFLSGDSQSSEDERSGAADEAKRMGAGALRAAQEWRAAWEKLLALTVARTQTEEAPPPRYTPRAEEQPDAKASRREREGGAGRSTKPATSDIRPSGYTNTAPIPDQEVNSYAYQPGAKQAQNLQKKHDRMLLIFWLPILFMSFIWALHNGVQMTFQALRTALKTPLR